MAVTAPTYQRRVKPIEDRFFSKIVFDGRSHGDTPCMIWAAALDSSGYGVFWDSTRTEAGHPKTVRAHRWLYERWFGPVPEGLDLDHLCRVRECVNPDHLEPVTRAENLARSDLTPQAVNAAKTHCPQGHEYTPENTYFGRRSGRTCRRCAIDRATARQQISTENPTNRKASATP